MLSVWRHKPRTQLNLQQTQIILNGDQALEFVRARYPFTDGDYTRVRNQQLFLKGVMQKLFTRETLTNPGMIAETVDQFSPYLTVDAGFDSAYLTGLGLSLRDIRTENLRFFTAPTLGTGMEGSQSVVYPDWASLEQLALHLQNDTVDQYEPTGR
jgi:anionic cell wall polymer biosynthesis LytR-Cps2A-Psr (LCP) family protein